MSNNIRIANWCIWPTDTSYDYGRTKSTDDESNAKQYRLIKTTAKTGIEMSLQYNCFYHVNGLMCKQEYLMAYRNMHKSNLKVNNLLINTDLFEKDKE